MPRGVKVFLRWCFDESIIDSNITLNVKCPKSDAKLVQPLSVEDVDAVERHICRFRSYRRNLLIVHLMLDCGLRRGEVCRLNVGDVNMTNGYIHIVKSKNCKSRIIPLPTKVKVLIADYLENEHYLYTASSPLVMDNSCEHRLSKSAINSIVYRLKKVIPRVYPHLCRHTFGTSFCMGNGNLSILSVLMGHSDIQTTQGYVHIANQCKIVNYNIYKLDKVMFQYCNYNYKE